MKLRQYLTLIMLFSLFNLYGQNKLKPWILSFSFGLEKHDKRLFDYVEKEALLELQPEKWGTFNWGLSFKRKMQSIHNINIFLGTGIEYKKETFIRPFDHTYFGKDFLEILRYQNSYQKIFVPLTIDNFWKLGNNFYWSLTLKANVLLYRKIDNTEYRVEGFPYSEATFEFNDVELMTGLNYNFSNISFGLSSRIINFQKVDKILFNRILKYPSNKKNWELYNPFKLELFFGYNW